MFKINDPNIFYLPNEERTPRLFLELNFSAFLARCLSLS